MKNKKKQIKPIFMTLLIFSGWMVGRPAKPENNANQLGLAGAWAELGNKVEGSVTIAGGVLTRSSQVGRRITPW